MNPTNTRVSTVLTVAALVLFLGAFFALATDFGHNWDNHHKSSNLAALATTTTSETFPITTTTTFTVDTTIPVATTIAPVTPTTVKRTTATTRRTTATTKKPTPTTAPAPAPPFNGAGQETSDNAGTFTHNADNSYTGHAAAAGSCAASDPLCFNLGSGSSSADHPNEVQLVAILRNHTSRTITFPGGLKLNVTTHNPNGTTTEFVMDASTILDLQPNESVTISTETSFIPTGDFTFDAVCQVDYGS